MFRAAIYNYCEEVFNKKRLFAKIFLPVLILTFFVFFGLASSPVSAATITWQGNGTTNGLCNDVRSDSSVPAGQQQWLFILTNPDPGPWTLTASFSPPTTSNPITVSGTQQGGGSVHFTVNTTIGAQLLSATATNGSAQSNLVVSHCSIHRQLQVNKTANATFNRSWDWTIDKTCDQTQLTLAVDEQFTVNCSVSVDADSTDSGWSVAGNITIHNPDPALSATITSVTDVITGPIGVTPVCGVTFPYTLVAGGTLTCTYSAPLPDATSRTNTATVTTTGSIAGNSAVAPITFSSTPTTETDECIAVTDDKHGSLGNACANETLPKVFNYTQNISFSTCGERPFVNTASFMANDTQTTGSDSWTVNVSVPCIGCTLTQGYWKTHNTLFRGGAPADDTWLLLGAQGPSTPFFLSDKTWFQVFWTAPGGNAYYQLAHQYMAARLNILNDASAPANVQTAIASATALFSTYTPAQVAAMKGNNTTRAQFISLAGILGNYNQGIIGPGHCSE